MLWVRIVRARRIESAATSEMEIVRDVPLNMR